MQWVSGALSLGIKHPGCEVDCSPHNAEVRDVWSYVCPLPNMPSCHGAQLKHRNKFTLALPHVSDTQ